MKNFKKAMKNFKKVRLSLGMKIIALLSCVALLSMGFASWWILKLPDPAVKEGSFEVYTVDIKNVTFQNVAFTDTTISDGADGFIPSSNIILGKTTGTSKWLVAGDDVKDQNLEAILTFDIVIGDGENATTGGTSNLSDFLSSVEMKFETIDPSETVTNYLNTAISNGYITAPVFSYSYTPTGGTEQKNSETYQSSPSSSDTTKDNILVIDMTNAAANKVTVTVKITFQWGDTFGGMNPYTYYNQNSYTADKAAEAKAALSALSALDDDTFKVTLTAKGKA